MKSINLSPICKSKNPKQNNSSLFALQSILAIEDKGGLDEILATTYEKIIKILQKNKMVKILLLYMHFYHKYHIQCLSL